MGYGIREVSIRSVQAADAVESLHPGPQDVANFLGKGPPRWYGEARLIRLEGRNVEGVTRNDYEVAATV